MDDQRIYRTALEKWGADAQTLMVFEEMAELQKELCKAARGKDNQEAIEDTHIHEQSETPDGVKVEAVERLQNLCNFCKEMESCRDGDSGDAGRQYGLIKGRAWGIDVVMLEFAISVLSELREIKEVRIPAEPNTSGYRDLLEDWIEREGPEKCHKYIDEVRRLKGWE